MELNEIKEKLEKLRSEQIKDFGARLVDNKLEIENIENDIDGVKSKLFFINYLYFISLFVFIGALVLNSYTYIHMIICLFLFFNIKFLERKLKNLKISLSYEKRLSIVEDFYISQLRASIEELVTIKVKGGK